MEHRLESYLEVRMTDRSLHTGDEKEGITKCIENADNTLAFKKIGESFQSIK